MSRLERIVAACGGILLDNGKRALICGPEHSRADRSVSLMLTEDGRILIHCFSPRDDWRSVRAALAAKGLLDATAPIAAATHAAAPQITAQPQAEERIARARRIWDESRAIRCTAAGVYLRYRAIPPELWDSPALRFHPRMTALDDRQRRPSLIAAITDAGGELVGVQVTLLSAHGVAKAAVSTPRRVIGKLMGGAVRLREPTDQLAIGEGIETMLSASQALDLPAWAALTADNLSLFDPPQGVNRLVVAVDNDAAGYAAYAKLKMRLGIAVEAAQPPNGADDWNSAARMRA
jgi:phage/plasmid primase-like uncharacterized protein